jgi:hypothetical protein
MPNYSRWNTYNLSGSSKCEVRLTKMEKVVFLVGWSTPGLRFTSASFLVSFWVAAPRVWLPIWDLESLGHMLTSWKWMSQDVGDT